jgi:hypothetical protein
MLIVVLTILGQIINKHRVVKIMSLIVSKFMLNNEFVLRELWSICMPW